jgi:hypothetical protein
MVQKYNGLFNTSSSSAAELSVIKFITKEAMNSVTLKSDSDAKQSCLRGHFVERMLMLSLSFRCDQISKC